MALRGIDEDAGRARWRFRDAIAGTEMAGFDKTLRALLRPDL